MAVASALVSFYVTYLAYRNLKSVVPLLRPDDLFDRRLADLDRSLFAGHDPATLLHSAARHRDLRARAVGRLRGVLPLHPGRRSPSRSSSCRDLRAGLFLTTALAINWSLAAASYFLLPSLGPIYAEPADFAAAAHHRRQRPAGGAARRSASSSCATRPPAGTAQSIGAFASLHVSIFFTAALATHLLGSGGT